MPRFSVFFLPQKPTFPNSNSISFCKQCLKSHSVDILLVISKLHVFLPLFFLSPFCFVFFPRFLTYDPKRRITADDALKHDYFQVSALCSSDKFLTFLWQSNGGVLTFFKSAHKFYLGLFVSQTSRVLCFSETSHFLYL